jgi:hypothetical protein
MDDHSTLINPPASSEIFSPMQYGLINECLGHALIRRCMLRKTQVPIPFTVSITPTLPFSTATSSPVYEDAPVHCRRLHLHALLAWGILQHLRFSCQDNSVWFPIFVCSSSDLDCSSFQTRQALGVLQRCCILTILVQSDCHILLSRRGKRCKVIRVSYSFMCEEVEIPSLFCSLTELQGCIQRSDR